MIRASCLAVLILFLGVACLSLHAFWKDFLQYRLQKISEASQTISRDVVETLGASTFFLKQIRGILGPGFSLKPDNPASDHEALEAFFREFKANRASDTLGLTLIVDSTGKVVNWFGPYGGLLADLSDRPFFKEIKADPTRNFALNGLVKGRAGGRPIYEVGIPVRNSQGTLECVLAQQVDALNMDKVALGIVGGLPVQIVVQMADGGILFQHPLPPLLRDADPATRRPVIGEGIRETNRDGILRIPAGSPGFAETTYAAVSKESAFGTSTAVLIPEGRLLAIFWKNSLPFLVVILLGGMLIVGLFYGLCLGGQKLDCAVQQTVTDHQTGIANRRGFDNELQRLINHTQRQNQSLCLLFADIDHFKSFNDDHGHDVGDEVLKGVAECIRRSLRRPLDYCSRWGGEEFTLILPDTGLEEGILIAKELLDCVAALPIEMLRNTPSPSVTLSIGMACLSAGQSKTPSELIHEADRALLRAKSDGRNRVVVG